MIFQSPHMRKNLFVTYLTKSCLRVYISQLETTPLNMTTKNTKTLSDQRKQCIPVLQNRWSERFLFFWLQGNLAHHNRPTCKVPTAEASLGPQTTSKTLRSASKPRFSWLESLESQVSPLPKPPPAEAIQRFRRSELPALFLARGSLYRS